MQYGKYQHKKLGNIEVPNLENANEIEEDISKLYHLPKLGGNILQYDINTKHFEKIKIPNWSCKNGARGCVISEEAIFVCGGYESGARQFNEAWSINLRARDATRMPDMIYNRYASILAQMNQVIYVFGGHKKAKKLSKSSEEFKNGTWQPLPSMNYGKSSGNAIIWASRIYLSGYGSNKIEVFKPKDKSFGLLPLTLYYSNASTLSWVFGNEMVILQNEMAMAINLNHSVATRRNQIASLGWGCSVSTGINGNKVIFLKWDDALAYRFSIKKLDFARAKNLF